MASKPSPAKPGAAKTAPKTSAARKKPLAAPVVEPAATPDTDLAEKAAGTVVLKLKDLVERITESSGAKKKDVKDIVEATLAQLGAALARGEAMSLQGFGHLRVARKSTADNPVMTLKLRPGEGKGKAKSDDADAKEGLAEDSEAS